MIGCGFSLMIPSAEAARSTDDLRTVVTPANGAVDGGCGKRDLKANQRVVAQSESKSYNLSP